MQYSGTATSDLPDLCREAPATGGGGVAVSEGADVADKTRSSSTCPGDWSTTPSSKSLSSSIDKLSEDDSSVQCGWGPLQPRCCQVFRNTKVVLFFLCCVATIQVTRLFALNERVRAQPQPLIS